MLLFCVITSSIDAQVQFGTRLQYGFLMPHRQVMQYLVQGHSPSLEIYYEKILYKQSWHHLYKFPSAGISFYTANTGNKINLGNAHGLYAYTHLHFLTYPKVEWNVRLGMGLGYIEKTFNRIDNNKNYAIASHINGLVVLASECKLKFKKYDLGAGISFTHFSNGAFKVPNLGINIPAVFFNANYKLNSDFNKPVIQTTAFEKKQTILSGASIGFKEIMPAGGPKYICVTLTGQYLYQVSPKSAFAVGLDIFYTPSIYYQVMADTLKNAKKIDYTQLGIIAGYELCLGNLSAMLQFGAYTITKSTYDGYLYHRIGIRYYFAKNLYANLTLKTHFAKADFIEWGWGYRFAKANKANLNNHHE